MPQQLPSFFHSSHRVPSGSTWLAGSIAPPAAAGHTSGTSPTGRNGPVGELARATAMHCTSGSTLCTVTYMTNPSPTADTSGAQVRPLVAHAGRSGSGSVRLTVQVCRSVELASWTFRLPLPFWVA